MASCCRSVVCRSFSLETRMYPTSMSENLPLSCFRQSEQSDMFSEQILSGFHESVKAPWLGVGKHLFVEQSPPSGFCWRKRWRSARPRVHKTTRIDSAESRNRLTSTRICKGPPYIGFDPGF